MNTFAAGSNHPFLEHIQQSLAAALDQVSSGLDSLEAAATTWSLSPEAFFKHVRQLEEPFRRLDMEWTELRGTAGIMAAEAIRSRFDVEAGWRREWDDLFSIAWDLRSKMECDEALGSTDWQIELTRRMYQPEYVPRYVALRDCLALDLRYGVGRALSEIADYVSMSTATVQMRIADFESTVLATVAGDAIERQLPKGWELVDRRPRPSVGAPAYNLLRARDGRTDVPRIALDLLTTRGERETTAGRPRSIGRPLRAREINQATARIWVVVFSSGPRVVFVPQQMLLTSVPPTEISAAHIFEVARIAGVEQLDKAIAIATTEREDAKRGA
jgi:hypothetical protein